MKALRVTDYGRDWFRTKRQAGRIAREYNSALFDAGCIEILEESVREPLTEGK